MMRFYALGLSGHMCCLPSPYRIPQRVAGMAFNFSQVEVAPPSAGRTRAVPPRRPDEKAVRDEGVARLFGSNPLTAAVY